MASSEEDTHSRRSDGNVSLKAPPAFNPDCAGSSYEDWKLDISLWEEFTTLPKTKHGTAFLLVLKEGKVKDVVRSLGKEAITADDGLKVIIEQLDKIYEEDSALMSYRVYRKFVTYIRPEDMNLQDYMSEFEKLVADLRKIKLTLPEVVLAYSILNSANLPQDKVELALNTVKSMTYKDMCITIGKMFSVQTNVDNAGLGGSQMKIKTEECNYTQNFDRGKFRGNQSRGNRGGYRGNLSRGNRGGYHPYNKGNTGKFYSGCFICGDKQHFARDCEKKHTSYFTQNNDKEPSTLQHNTETNMEVTDESSQKAYITLLAMQIESEKTADCLMNGQPDVGSLVHETLGCAVIDSGCTKTVVGRSWVNCYYETMTDREKAMMKSEACMTPFKFGDGIETISKEKIKIPGCIGNNNILIEANIVECELPLLLSKPALKRVGAVLDFQNDAIVFNGEKIKLIETKSGHYGVPICVKRQLVSDGIGIKKPKLILTVTEETLFGTDLNEMKKKAIKLHRQFSHAPAYKLITLLKTGGFNRQNFFKVLEEVCENCELCLRYKKPKPRPVVGLPCGKKFNDTVALDLKTLDFHNNVHMLHMIDSVTRFSVGKIVRNKRKETIAAAMCSGWIALFGKADRFMADNGGEFANEEYTELCERFNIVMQSSAGYSPFSNGMVERHHAMLAEMTVKTKQESNCSWEVAMSWSLSAKNSMQMFGGFSSYQMTIGFNPTLPNVIDNELPALAEETCVSKVVEQNLKAMHAAREQFARCESSAKIKKALKSNVRTCNDEFFDNNEKVWYKRNDSKEWHGPAIVLGRENQCIIVKHGNQYIKVHPCHITRGLNSETSDQQNNKVIPNNTSGNNKSKKTVSFNNPMFDYDEEGDIDHEETVLDNTRQQQTSSDSIRQHQTASDSIRQHQTTSDNIRQH